METLKQERCWCVWKREEVAGRQTKVPYISRSRKGRSDTPESWIDYEEADKLCREYPDEIAGKGIFLSTLSDGMALCGIDIDAHHGEDGEGNELAEEVLKLFEGTYIEKSPSGNGYHILCRVDLEQIEDSDKYYQKNSKNELEIYIGNRTNRYLTYTGNKVSEGDAVTDQTEQVIAFRNKYMLREERARSSSGARKNADGTPEVPTTSFESREHEPFDLEERLQKIRESKDGERFAELYDRGDLSRYDDDHSKADWILASILCYWLEGDYDLVDKAFHQSKLMRDKWDERRKRYGTYGRMTICNVMRGMETFYEPSADEAEDAEELPPPPDNTFSQQDIFDFIHEVIDNEEHKDDVSVVPLMCGTGKSTAISMMIREVIENLADEEDIFTPRGDGIIIVTDRIKRLGEYLQPRDAELREFIKNNMSEICVMTSENYKDKIREQQHYPILLMTTQRYFNLTVEEIETFLRWEHGTRPLVLIDELPQLKVQQAVTIKDITNIGLAFKQCIDDRAAGKKVIVSDWDVITKYISSQLTEGKEILNKIRELAQQRNEESMETKLLQQISGEAFFWKPDRAIFDPCRDDILHFIKVHKDVLDANDEKYCQKKNMFSIVQTLFDIVNDTVLCVQRTGYYSEQMIMLMKDNYPKVKDISAKVVILDGTADVSPEYNMDPYDTVPCEQFQRNLSKMTIHIVNIPTSRSSWQRDRDLRKRALDSIEKYVYDRIPKERNPKERSPEEKSDEPREAVFSYYFLEDEIKERFPKLHRAHFGKIVGENDFREDTNIFQIGINHFPAEAYWIYETQEVSKSDVEEAMEQFGIGEKGSILPFEILNFHVYARKNGKQAEDDLMEKYRKEDRENKYFYMSVRNRILMAELEQNIFRGVIRNSDNQEDYNFHLFIRQETFPGLIELIEKRYKKLGAAVDIVPTPQDYITAKIMERKGDPRPQRLIRWHDEELEVGQEYTTEDIHQAIDGDEVAFRNLKSSRRDLAAWLSDERKQRGTYVKKGNWTRR